jgi:RsiW-degrading membrane proteinase PrsW (M82 family)
MNTQKYEQAVFISYAWGGESEEIVNQIDDALQQRGLTIIRDKRELGYKGSISTFMERIGQGNCVIVVISDKYLRSSNCMFELVEIANGKQFHDRVFPIVLSDANIYDPVKRLDYVKHWESKLTDLDKAMRKVSQANLQGIREDIDLYDRIRDNVSGLTSILKDMNTLTPEMHRNSDFSEIYTGIERRTGGISNESKPESGKSPYMGLQYFDTSDADLFYGREVLAHELTERLSKESFLAIVGASGSGKSSVARAGLIPKWKASTSGLVHVITPNTHPLESLSTSLTRDSESVTATSTLMDDMIKDTRSLRLFVHKLLSSSGQTNLLLIVDQFEEIFTLCKDRDQRKAFIENLLSLVDDGKSGTRVVITLRADFYHHCFEYEGLRLILEKHQANIGAMTPDELREVITQPAENNKWGFQPGLVDLILQEVGTEPGALPLLSHALLETWERRQGRTLTLQGYYEAGGVKKAIANTAESVYNNLNLEDKEKMRNIFVRLTRLDASGKASRDTSRRVNIKNLALKNDTVEQTAKFIRTLTSSRLLITSSETVGEQEVEVSHEALIRNWPRLRSWLDEDRLSLLVQENLREAASIWDTSDKDKDAIDHRGGKLEDALHLSRNPGTNLATLEQEYLDACLKEENRFANTLKYLITKWNILIFTIISVMLIAFSQYYIPDNGNMITGLIIATAVPLFVLSFLYKLDRYRILEFKLMVFCLIGGGIGYLIAAQINPTLISSGVSMEIVMQYVSPISDNIFKGLILYLILGRLKFARIVDGIIYGFAIGTGFAVFENFEYILTNSVSAISIAVGRVFSTNLIHMSAAGIAGFLFTTARLDKNTLTIIARILLAFAMPALLNAAFNITVRSLVSSYLLLAAMAFGLLPMIGLVIGIRKLINDDQKWVEKFLQSDKTLTDFPLDNIQKISSTIRNLFGSVRASQIERIIILQARRGILQRSLQNEKDTKFQYPIKDQLNTVRKKINGGRVVIGNYCWKIVTSSIPELTKLIDDKK